MLESKYYPEEELIDMYNRKEIDLFEFVCHHSEEKKQRFVAFCAQRDLPMDNNSAQRFLDMEEREFEEALENGEA
jgi:hypothetical protein